MAAEMQCQLAKSAFQFSVSNVSRLNGRLYSSETPTGAIGNIYWRCFVEPHQGSDGNRYLSFGIEIISHRTYISFGTGGSDAGTTRRVYSVSDNETLRTVEVSVTLFDRKRGKNHIHNSKTEHFSGSQEFAWNCFIEWSRLIDEESGFLELDGIEFGVGFAVGMPQSALAKLDLPLNSGGEIEATQRTSVSVRTSLLGGSSRTQKGRLSSKGAAVQPLVHVQPVLDKASVPQLFTGDESQPKTSSTATAAFQSDDIADNESTFLNTQFTEATFLLTVHNISKLSAKIYSQPAIIRNIEWRCYVGVFVAVGRGGGGGGSGGRGGGSGGSNGNGGETFLEVGVKCRGLRAFKCRADLGLKLRHPLSVRHDFNATRTEYFTNGSECGWPKFVPWSKLLSAAAGFVQQGDRISLKLFVKVQPWLQESSALPRVVLNNNLAEAVNNQTTHDKIASEETQQSATSHTRDDNDSSHTQSHISENSSVQKSTTNVGTQKNFDTESSCISSASQMVDSLRCPVCQRLLEPPVFLCGTGHSICNRCAPHTVTCPTCTNVYLDRVRNHAVEKVMNYVFFPCHFSLDCSAKLALNERRTHIGECLYRDAKCPLPHCPWRGPLIEFKGHSQSHKVRLVPLSNTGIQLKFCLSLFKGKDFHRSSLAFSFNDEVFVFRLSKCQGLYFLCIEMIGLDSDAKEYLARVVVLSTEAIAAKLSARSQREALSKNERLKSCQKILNALSDQSSQLSTDTQREATQVRNQLPSASPLPTSLPIPGVSSEQSSDLRSSSSGESSEDIRGQRSSPSGDASHDVAVRNLAYECKIHSDMENESGKCIPLPPESMLMRNHCDSESKLHMVLSLAKVT